MYNIEKLANSEVLVKIELGEKELKDLRAKVLEKYKSAKVDGFRKGHVPMDVIEKTFGTQIKEDLLNETLNSVMPLVIKENNLSLIGQMELENYSMTDDKLEIQVKFEVKPEFELPEYKGLKIELEKEEVTEAEVEDKLKNIASTLKSYETLAEDAKAELGHIANINFEGFVDGVAFEGGKFDGYDLKLGSKSFIDTFEDQIIDHVVNDEFDVNVVFPEEYHQENLKGKPALFKVKLNSLKVEKLPEINDEMAKLKGYDTLEDYKKALIAEIEVNKEEMAKNKKYEQIADHLVKNTVMELPLKLVESEAEHQFNEMKNQLSMQGIDMSKFYEMSGKTEEDYKELNKERATNIVKYNFIISKIAEIEKIEVSKEEVENELEKVANMYRMTKEELIAELQKSNMLENYMNQMSGTVYMEKMRKFLIENN